VNIYIYMYIYTHIYICIYIYEKVLYRLCSIRQSVMLRKLREKILIPKSIGRAEGRSACICRQNGIIIMCREDIACYSVN
jgi:hypothetical protein